MDKKKIIMDVDTGTDDAVAIAIAALNPNIELLGLTVTHGNQSLENTVENTLRMVEFLKKDIPVYAGCPEPMVQYLLPGRVMNVRRQITERVINGEVVSIHSKHLDLPPATIKPQFQHACSYIIETLKHSAEKLTIVATGPLTNIGMALRMDPSISENIEEIVVLGGGIYTGNRTPMAEANFYDDPEAAQIVIKSGCRVRLITIDAVFSVKLGAKEIERFRSASYVGNFVADLTEDFIRRGKLLRSVDVKETCLADVVAICATIDPSIVTDIRHKACDVDISGGWADGELIIDNRVFAKPTDPVYIAYAVDRERCIDIMVNSFEKAE